MSTANQFADDEQAYLQFSFLAYVGYKVCQDRPFLTDAVNKREEIARGSDQINSHDDRARIQAEALAQYQRFLKEATTRQKAWVTKKIDAYDSNAAKQRDKTRGHKLSFG